VGSTCGRSFGWVRITTIDEEALRESHPLVSSRHLRLARAYSERFSDDVDVFLEHVRRPLDEVSSVYPFLERPIVVAAQQKLPQGQKRKSFGTVRLNGSEASLRSRSRARSEPLPRAFVINPRKIP
jgi:hypothetical protein